MRKQKLTGITAVCVLLTLLAAILAACGGQVPAAATTTASAAAATTAPASATAAVATAAATASTTTTAAAAADNADGEAAGENGLPIVSEPLTLTHWIGLDAKASASLTSFDEMLCYQEMAKRTGITYKFIHPPVGQSDEQFNLMVASGDLPDIIQRKWSTYPGGPEKAINDKVIIPLNDLISQYTPDYQQVLDMDPVATRMLMTDAGVYSYFGDFSLDQESGALHRGMISNGFMIRQDWLNELGLEIPTTIDEWYTVLTAMKGADLNGNGEDDEIPFVSQKLSVYNYGMKQFAGAWGVFPEFIIVDGQIKYGPIEPGYREYLETMAQWYAEGLFDPEFATNDEKAFDAKVMADQAGAFYCGLMGGMGRYVQLKENEGITFDIIGAPYPKNVETGKEFIFQSTDKGTGGAAITTANKYPVESAKLLNYHYTDEGHMLLNFGVEGLTYEMVDGQPQFTELITKNPDGLSVDQAVAHYAMGSIGSASFRPDVRVYEQRCPYDVQNKTFEIWSNATLERRMVPVTPSGEETTRMSTIMAQVNTYRDEMTLRFVMGQEPIGNFDTYVQNLRGMGIDEAITINQAALERFEKRGQ